jgi:hypothetical protein
MAMGIAARMSTGTCLRLAGRARTAPSTVPTLSAQFWIKFRGKRAVAEIAGCCFAS